MMLQFINRILIFIPFESRQFYNYIIIIELVFVNKVSHYNTSTAIKKASVKLDRCH